MKYCFITSGGPRGGAPSKGQAGVKRKTGGGGGGGAGGNRSSGKRSNANTDKDDSDKEFDISNLDIDPDEPTYCLCDQVCTLNSILKSRETRKVPCKLHISRLF